MPPPPSVPWTAARLPYVPKWSTGLDGEYKWAAFRDYNGFLGATYSYVGSRRTDFASSATDPTGQTDRGQLQHRTTRGSAWTMAATA